MNPERTDYLNARKVWVSLRDGDSLHLVLAGCGGTGSWLAPHLARLARLLHEKFNLRVSLIFVDPDVVEAKNCYRQNFCAAEIGRSKAETLALRYSAAWGVNILALAAPFSCQALESAARSGYGAKWVVVGCVDNTSARRDIRDFIETKDGWWLDCGNTKTAGQILLGRSPLKKGEQPLAMKSFCAWLPLPSVQHPDLLESAWEPTAPVPIQANLSCADLALLDSQSLTINNRVAGEAADFLFRLLVTRDLKRYACYLNLEAGSQRSLYATDEALEKYL